MKRLLVFMSILLVLLPSLLLAGRVDMMEDNDFAEFEESDDGQLIFTLLPGYLPGVVATRLEERRSPLLSHSLSRPAADEHGDVVLGLGPWCCP